MNKQNVLFDVAKERGRQDEKYGGPAHDDSHTTGEFAGFIEDRAYKIRCLDKANRERPINYGRGNLKNPRQLLVEIAALAVAAIESIDRKDANNGND